MIKNKSMKKILFLITVLFLFNLVMFLSYNYSLERKYQKEVSKSNNYLVSKIIEEYPDLKDDLLTILLEDNPDYQDSPNYDMDLSKYKKENISSLIKSNYFIIISISLNFLFILIILILNARSRKKKIEKLDKYLYEVINGNYTLDIKDYEEDDLSSLKDDIYKVSVKLREANELVLKDKKEMEAFLYNISHQLKTPLTSMNIINEILLNDKIDDIKRRELLKKNEHELKKIEWLITSLLKLSRLDSGTITLRKDKIALKEVINKVLEETSLLIDAKEIEVIITNCDNLEIIGDFEWTVEAILNIIKNAIEHTLEKGKIWIEGSSNPIYNQISIKDNGSGIAKEDLHNIFKRFYKGKNQKPDSIGIGLNMSKTIIERESGDISVTSSDNGTTFNIKFYKVTVL